MMESLQKVNRLCAYESVLFFRLFTFSIFSIGIEILFLGVTCLEMVKYPLYHLRSVPNTCDIIAKCMHSLCIR